MIDQAELSRLRTEVDHIDLQLVELLAARQRVVEAVAVVKGEGVQVRDREREQAILARIREAALGAGLSPAIALPLWNRLLEVSVEHERGVLARSPAAATGASCCGCQGRDGV